jgi:60 kDa SS-A/Ro ribonucleoprotein
MGFTALVRNLGKMTSVGTLRPLGAETRTAVRRLTDDAEIRRARVHPFAILQALAVYRNGRGVRGGLTWQPIPAIIDALDTAFYRAFANVQPTNKRILIALDVSGSMGSAMNGSPLTVREAGAALALVTAKSEPSHHIVGFSAGLPGAWVSSPVSRHGHFPQCRAGDGISPLRIGARTRLDDAVRAVADVPFGATDCALPMLYAAAKRIDVDVFVVVTDNETWAGTVHPAQALRDYRQKTGIAAKLIVVAMTSTGFSIADPDDGGMLDVVGFDSAAPAVMADFARG